MPVKVLIVDDSMLFRTKLQMSLGSDSDLTVVGCAADPEEGFRMIGENNPDVLVLDMEMPGISGLGLLKKQMLYHPIPTIAISVLPANGLEALAAGAVEFVSKPQSASHEAQEKFLSELLVAVKVASVAKAKTAQNATLRSTLVSRLARAEKGDPSDIVAIGASTGGTEAIIEVVKNLPASFPGVIIVQHMPATFTTLYAQRLGRVCQMKAKEAEDLDRVLPGQIIVAAGEYHLTLKKDARGYYIRSKRGEKVSGHCPSVDVMFDSVAETAGRNAVGVILTGMGADGACGITKLHQMGAYTIGQDKDSCVVYGMPMEAYKMGGISRQLPLESIGDELIYYFRKKNKP